MLTLGHSIHMSSMAEKEGKKSKDLNSAYSPSTIQQGSSTFRLNLWNQISLDLEEYPTDSSSPLKIHPVLAYQNMNVTVFLVQFGNHPSTGVMTKSDEL